MANTGGRMLRLLALLQSRRYWSGDELARRLDISERTLRRDIERLRDLGYRIGASPGVGGGYQLAVGGTMPPVLFDDDEAVAMAVGLRAAAAHPIAEIDETSVRALAKLVRLLPAHLRRRVDALARATAPTPAIGLARVSPDLLVVLALACRDARRIRFTYTSRRGERLERLAEPNRLVVLGRHWYLVAWDLDRKDWRTFRIDLMTDPVETGHSFRHRALPLEDAAAFVESSIAAVPAGYDVIVVIRASAAEVAGEVAQWGKVEALGPDRCLLEMRVDDLSWVAMMLAAIDADFEIQQPGELGDYLARIGRRFAARGSGTTVARTGKALTDQ